MDDKLSEGYVKLFRRSIKSEVFQNDKLWKVWCWCLMRAKHTPGFVTVPTGTGNTQVYLRQGEFIFGRNKASEALSMPPSSVWDRMRKLQEIKNLDIKPDTHFSIVSILNWDIYQGNQEEDQQAVRQPADNQPTTSRQPADTYKNEKKEKNDKNYPDSDPEIFCEIPCKTGLIYQVKSSLVEELKSTYPNIDVENEIKKARMWNVSRDSNDRKTKRGMGKFLTNWMCTAEKDRLEKVKSDPGRHEVVDQKTIEANKRSGEESYRKWIDDMKLVIEVYEIAKEGDFEGYSEVQITELRLEAEQKRRTLIRLGELEG